MKNMFALGAILTLLILTANDSRGFDIMNLRDQSTLRCPGGIVARGDSDIDVQRRCGEPIKVAYRQDFGPIWTYHFGQARFMYYLAFLRGNLQRIASARCNPNRPGCLDIR